MVIRAKKYTFIEIGLDDATKDLIYNLFPYKISPLNDGCKYLGYFISPNNYFKVEWSWLLKKVDKKLDNWTYTWLSLGGRLILTKSMLENIPVYYLSLEKTPIVLF